MSDRQPQRDLLAAVDRLPSALDPDRDLWPQIEARLARRPSPSVLSWPRRRPWGTVYQLAAALALMVLGGALSQLLWPALPGAAPPGAAPPGAAPPGAAPRVATSTAALLPAASPAADLWAAEAEVLRLKETLVLAALGRHQDLMSGDSPGGDSAPTLEVVERNLRILDRAIRDLRQALAENPGDPRLENLLFANHRRSIELLRRLTRSQNEI